MAEAEILFEGDWLLPGRAGLSDPECSVQLNPF
jgi:hypothetical protein